MYSGTGIGRLSINSVEKESKPLETMLESGWQILEAVSLDEP